jgi:RHS repeat-associated protein
LKGIATFVIALYLAAPIATDAAIPTVGSVPGSFDVSLSGSATYAVPIRTPPGTAGVEPRISLVYDSQAPSGSLGAGWSVAGLSAITRGPKNARSDGVPDGVRMAETDALYLDGQRLLPIGVTQSNGNRRTEYRKEIDDQTRIIEIGDTFGSAKFIVNTKGGLRIEFDSVPGSPPDKNRGDIRFADGSVLLRAESRVSDSSGNYIDFFYRVNGSGDYDIKSIQYTGHEPTAGNPSSARSPYAIVEFSYESTSRIIRNYVAGHPLIVDSRLTGIISRVSTKPKDPANGQWLQAARYSLEYEDRDTANRFVLKGVHQYGEDDAELTPTKFSYSAPTIGWADPNYSFPAILASHQELAAGYRFAHVSSGSGNALPDLLYASRVEGKIEAFAYQNNGTTWTELGDLKPPVPFTRADGGDLGAIVTDIDGDGRADILQSYQLAGEARVTESYVAGAKTWEKKSGFDLPFVVSRDGKVVAQYRFARWSGGPGPDMVYQSEGQAGFLRNTVDGWKVDAGHLPPLDLGEGTWVLDIDCSGRPALVGTSKNADGTLARKVFRYGSAKWLEDSAAESAFPIPPSADPRAIRVISVDGSTCPGLLVATAQDGGLHDVFQAKADGTWNSIASKKPQFDLVDGAGNVSDAVVANDPNGLSVIFAHRVFADGHEVKFYYSQDPTQWIAAPSTFQVPLLSATSNTYVGDLTGSGAPCIAIAENSRQSFGKVFVLEVTGFTEKPNYQPPVFFSRKDRQDNGVRLVDLNGDGLPDVLASRAGGDAPAAWTNTGAGWSPQSGLTPPVPFAGTEIAGNPVQFVDVDGDGYLDLLYSYRSASGTSTRLFHNVADANGGRTWSEVTSADPNLAGLIPPAQYPFAGDKVGDLGVRFADLAGDGRVYMLVGLQPPGPGAKPQLMAYRNDGTKWIPAPEFAPPIPFVELAGANVASRDLEVQIVDINGDGLPDIVASFHSIADPKVLTTGVWLNTGHGWAKENAISIPVTLDGLIVNAQGILEAEKNTTIQWADVNGDGLPDIIYTRREGATNRSVTFLGTGAGWVAAPEWQIPIAALPDRGGDTGLRIIDVNGDGYPDLIYARQEADGSTTKGVYVNSGSGWLLKDEKAVPQIPFVDKDGNDLGVRLFDVDGRGLVDIIQAYSGDSTTAAIKINQSRRSDLVQAIDSGDGLVTEIYYATMLESAPTNVGALAVRADYRWPNVYVPAYSQPTSYPIVTPVPASYLVRRAVVSEGFGRHIAFSYRYGGYQMDALAKRSLGFAWRESVNEANDVLSHLELTQDVRYPSRIKGEQRCWLNFTGRAPGSSLDPSICTKSGNQGYEWIHLLTTSNQQYDVEEVSISGFSPLPHVIRQVVLSQSKSYSYELDGRPIEWHTDTFKYDEVQAPQTLIDRRLNVRQTATEWGDGSSVVTINEYDADDADRWFLGRLTKSTITKTRPGIKSETRAAVFTYFADTGLLESETANASTLREVTTTYGRDDFGNITERRLHASGIQDYDPTTYKFDDVGRFQISQSNPLHQTKSAQFYPTTGLPRSTKTLNGTETKYRYDGFGRLSSTEVPTSINASLTTTTEYLPLSALDSSVPVRDVPAVYAVRVAASDGMTKIPPTIKLLDSKGRVVRTIEEGFTKDESRSRLILRDVVYDSFGLVAKTSLPYQIGEKASWVVIDRDVLGRVIRQVSSNQRVTRTLYESLPSGGSVTTLIDVSRNHRATTTRDMHQLVTKIVDPAGGTVRYEYDAGDRPVKITDPIGAVTRFGYDNFGNRQDVVDPDAGSWHYEFDALGRVIEQDDKKAGGIQIARLEYDALGRLKQETLPSDVWTWEFDSSNNGIGQIANIKSASGRYQEQHFYDSVGRENEVATTISGESFETKQLFDNYGRISRLEYPGSFVAERVYDKKGFLTKVRDGTTKHSYWTLDATDSFGHLTRDSLGNGVREHNEFYSDSGRPKTVSAVDNAGNAIVDLRLTYDLVGNLKRRDEHVQSKSETFGYDALDRLKFMTKAAAPGETYSYDAAGRITSKTGVGSFKYAEGAPNTGLAQCATTPIAAHAVVSTIGTAGKESYSYDCHGNMTGTDTVDYTYSADNRLIRAEVKLPANAEQWVQFDYTADGSRFREQAKHGAQLRETISVGAYERITEFGMGSLSTKPRFIRHRWYLSNGTSVFAVVEKNHEEFDRDAGMIFHKGAALIGNTPVDETAVWYLHKDQLGSILAITDESARVRARFWYDPWGKRSGDVIDPTAVLPSGKRLEDSWSRGFLAQEQFADFSFIHLNGRIYEPVLGRFASADPINQSPSDSQMWDAYAYSRNNPLRYVDPSGYLSWDDVNPVRIVANGVKAVAQGVAHFAGEVVKWVGENYRQIIIVAAVVVVTVLTCGTGGPAAATLGTAILSGMAAGATAGALGAALYGGNFNDVMLGAIKGGIIGAASGAAFYGVGSLTAGGGALNDVEAVAGHGVVGGATEAAQGGNFWQGFASTALVKVSSIVVPSSGSLGLDTTRAAAVGGAAAAVGGGNFVNGAVTGAFSYAFNDAMHRSPAPPNIKDDAIYPTIGPLDVAAAAVGLGFSALVEGGAALVDYFTAEETTAAATAAIGESSTYIDITEPGSISNRQTDVTPQDFIRNLKESGFIERPTSGPGTLLKGPEGQRYYVDPNISGARPAPSADYAPPGGDTTIKIRLRQP